MNRTEEDIARSRRRMFPALAVLLGLLFAQNLLRRWCAVSFDAVAGFAGVELQGDAVRFFRSLIVNLAPVALILLYVRFGEGRSLKSAGFAGGRRAVCEYLLGAGAGVLLIAAIMLLSLLSGGVRFVGLSDGFAFVPFAASAVLSMVNIREESLFRGWFLTSEPCRGNIAAAIVAGSVVFGVVHCGNPEVTVLSVVNLMLLGLLLSLLFLLRGNIWIVAALHSAWNFAQGRIAGLAVSGAVSGGSLLKFEAAGAVGGFGLEASPCTTAILLAATLWSGKKFIYLYNKKRN